MPVDRLSYSSISTYLLCAKSWHWRYVLKPRVPVSVNLPFGTAFHKTVQAHIAMKAKGQVESWQPGEPINKDFEPLREEKVKPLVELWPMCWQAALNERNERGQEIKWDRPYDYYTGLGAKMLTAPDVVAAVEAIEPMVALTPTETAIIERKVGFRVPSVPVPIVGYIDMIAADGVPVDFKTASRKWSSGKEHSEMQPDFYLLGLNQEGYDLNPDRHFRYYIFTKTKSPTCQILETSRTWGQLFFTMKQISDVWDAIQAGVFPCNPTGWKCSEKYCEYWELCRGKEL